MMRKRINGDILHSTSPCLLIPSLQEKNRAHSAADENSGRQFFFSLAENRVYSAAAPGEAFPADTCVVGSSRGWLVLLDETGDSCRLFNPITQAQIRLPPLPCPPKQSTPHNLEFDPPRPRIIKAILSPDPNKNSDFWAIGIYGIVERKLVFHKIGDSKWIKVEGSSSGKHYADIICSEDQLFAAAEDSSIEVWDLRAPFFPQKQRTIAATFPPADEQLDLAFKNRDRHAAQIYVAKSLEKLLIIVRVVGEFVSSDGRVLSEPDLLTEEDTQPLVCPYRTLFFRVFELDPESGLWAAVKSLGHQALFLGGNESISLSSRETEGIEGNCIYFTDDYWERMDEDYLYGGHDCGVFGLAGDRVREVSDDLDLGDKIQPAPYWFTPSPWR